VIYLAPDTNVLLHYTLFTEIDWPAVAEPSDITLLFPATVIHELDARKYTGSDQRLQNRAQTVLRRSRSIIGSRSANGFGITQGAFHVVFKERSPSAATSA